ncbi:MAG: cyclopropane-fatty-acyl-phospholipid synthase family protein [Filomicrobium sp.]
MTSQETKASDKHLSAAKELVAELSRALDLDASVRLWDGSVVPLGSDVKSALQLTISSPGVISSLVRRPTLDRLIRHYAHGQIGLEGGNLIELGSQLADGGSRKRLKGISKGKLLKQLWPFLLSPAEKPERSRDFTGNVGGERRDKSENKDFIKFHYDVGNEFYELFLDPNMQYTCAYFTDWTNTVDQAQHDKIEMICRKLRLKPGDKLLDIGCGWGGLLCYAVENYGVEGYGITLSEAQIAYAKAWAEKRGLSDKVKFEIRDYADLDGKFDKITSIGMYEAIGISNIDLYFKTVRRVLADDGLFLNHAISRRAKRKNRRFSSRAEQRALQKYIFPGGELDDIGHTIMAMEQAGFEIHDVEGWREHYQLTTKAWCERLTARREEAIELVGEETYRIWIAYLAGCSLAFQRGSARLFQTLASRSAKGASPLPPTRADLYR